MLKLRVINNGDHVCLAWRPSDPNPSAWQPIEGCRGFAVQRRLKRGGQTTTSWLHNRVGFAADQHAPAGDEGWKWPFQRYLWWDYDLEPGDEVAYRVRLVNGANATGLTVVEPNPDPSDWSEAQSISSDFGDGVDAFFNRGIIATQWVTRALKAENPSGTLRKTLMQVIEHKGNKLRDGLGGVLKENLLKLLSEAPGKVYAALYELNDPEVLEKMSGLGKRCFLILGNGAFKPPTNDENAAVRAKLKAENKINVFDRLVTSGHFAHNKFFVFCDEQGKPQSVFTGSTNCTVTGLCTQANNGLLIRNESVAGAFFDAWQRLHQAESKFPSTLVKPNSTKRTFEVTDKIRVSTWFAPTDAAQDLEQARTLINAAKNGILFLFFNPGHHEDDPEHWTLLQTVLNRHAPEPNPNADSSLYIRGVVNQEIAGLTSTADPDGSDDPDPNGTGDKPHPKKRVRHHLDQDPAAPTQPVALFTGGAASPMRLPKDVLVPAAINQDYGNWEAELKGASSVMIHSKVVVLDPFGENPVVMTGSHNLGYKASHANDDNLVIVEGDAALAQAYAANIIAIFQEYRWRDYVAHHFAGHDGWKGLQDDDKWQAGHLTRDAGEMMFWVPG